jgi:hypothetical protein
MLMRKMAYGPQLKPKTSRTLRRLAWAMELPMSTTLEELIKVMPYLINSKIVCSACQDRSRCCDCYFKPHGKPKIPKSKLTALLKMYIAGNKKKKLALNKRFL